MIQYNYYVNNHVVYIIKMIKKVIYVCKKVIVKIIYYINIEVQHNLNYVLKSVITIKYLFIIIMIIYVNYHLNAQIVHIHSKSLIKRTNVNKAVMMQKIGNYNIKVINIVLKKKDIIVVIS